MKCYDTEMHSRLWLGTANYPSLAVLNDAISSAQVDVVTVALRRAADGGRYGEMFWQAIRKLGCRVLPNTAGCYSVQEAVTTAHMAREVFATNWIKLEVIGDSFHLQPNVFALVEAAKILTDDGFAVFPYTTTDLVVADQLLNAGCEVLMPWAAPIGSGRGVSDAHALRMLRATFPDTPLIIDAGIGCPSHAVQVMELGYDAVLLNTAVADAGDPVLMAQAFAQAIAAGKMAYDADCMEVRDFAAASTSVSGMPQLTFGQK